MKAKTITLSEMMKGNERNCLSAKRGLGLCHKCSHYGGKYRYAGSNRFWIKPCESRIVNPKYDRLLLQKDKHYNAMQSIDKKIEAL